MEISREPSKEPKESSGEEELEGLRGVRLSTLMMIVLWAGCIVFSSIEMDWTSIECQTEFDDDQTDDNCIRYSAVYRAATVAVIIMLVQGILSIFSIAIYDKFWIVKYALLVGATAAFVLLDADLFDDEGFTWVARIGGFAFIILQGSILLDFAYYWNHSWVDKSGMFGGVKSFAVKSTDCYEGCKNLWLCGLMIISFVYMIIFIVAMAVLYHFYGGEGCGDNVSIITVSLIMVLAAIVIQLFGQNGSIIASGIVAAYASYLTYVAVSLNPDSDCNPSIGQQGIYGIGQYVIGIVVSFISILWISAITSRRISSLLGNYSNLGVLSVVQGKHSKTETTNAKEELERHAHLAILNLSFVCILICFYISMIMTNWGTITKDSETLSPSSGSTSMWMQAVGAWVAVGLYIVGLIIPHFKLLPDSIWELQFNFGNSD